MQSSIIFIPVIREKKVGYFSKDISLHDKLGILPTVKEISLESNIRLLFTWQLIIFHTLIMKYRIQKNSCPMTSILVLYKSRSSCTRSKEIPHGSPY